MSWAVGYDETWNRDIGYGVPAVCDHPDCNEPIDRGLSYVCGGDVYGGEHGCGLFFCEKHIETAWAEDEDTKLMSNVCERCANTKQPFSAKPDTKEWVKWKLEHKSWQQWREENPDKVEEMRKSLEAKE